MSGDIEKIASLLITSETRLGHHRKIQILTKLGRRFGLKLGAALIG
jgi:hypothetical protein